LAAPCLPAIEARLTMQPSRRAIIVGATDLNDRRGAVVDPDTGASVAFAVDDDVLASIGPPPKAVARSSPTPTPTPIGSGSPFPTEPPPGFATVEEAADAAKRALEGDPQLLLRLIRPAGGYAKWFEQGMTDPMSRNEAWGWLTLYPDAKRTVDARPIVLTNAQHPTGEAYVTSQWLDFGGYPEQKADIMLGREGGRWYWTSVLLYRPPPIGAFPDTFNGYATLQSVTDTTIMDTTTVTTIMVTVIPMSIRPGSRGSFTGCSSPTPTTPPIR